jgi:hypothetical protein
MTFGRSWARNQCVNEASTVVDTQSGALCSIRAFQNEALSRTQRLKVASSRYDVTRTLNCKDFRKWSLNIGCLL